jgi:hypothetical protein
VGRFEKRKPRPRLTCGAFTDKGAVETCRYAYQQSLRLGAGGRAFSDRPPPDEVRELLEPAISGREYYHYAP